VNKTRLDRLIPALALLFIVPGLLVGCSGSVRATNWTGLVVRGDTVYVADLQQIVALEADSGDLIWSSTDDSELDNYGPFYTVTVLSDEALAVASQERVGGGFFAQPQGVLRAVTIEGDDVLWEFKETSGEYVAGGTVADGILIIGNSDGNLYAINVDDGDLAWDSPFSTGARIWSSPLIISDTVYVTSMDHHLYALDLTTGDQSWDSPFEADGAMTSQPLSLNDNLFVGAFDSKLYAVRRQDGEMAWPEPFEGESWFWGSPATDGSYIYAADVSGNVYAIDAETGREEWRESVGEQVAAGVLLSEDAELLLVGDNVGTIYALDPRDGSQLWSESSEGQLASMVIEGDVLYVTRLFSEQTVQAYGIDADDADSLWVYPPPEAD
jgi:outer membrane protein assembly factor BamB